MNRDRLVKGEFKHSPSLGIYGDCHRAAIASALNLPLSEVPHFLADNCGVEEFCKRERDFLATLGIVTATVPFTLPSDGAFTLQDLIKSFAFHAGGAYLLLGGTSVTGVNHTVVICPDATIWNPTIGDPEIVGPCDDGFYWITFFQSDKAK